MKVFMLNFSPIQKKLPERLFKSLKEECLEASDATHQTMISGLTDEGIPKHYFVNRNLESLNAFVLTVVNDYFEENKNAIEFKLKSDGIQPAGLHQRPPWINIQKQNEYIPNHDHSGFCSYTIWVNIPKPSKFEFVYNTITGEIFRNILIIDRDMEGTIMMFPSKLIHCVHPFYDCDESRISVSGNLVAIKG